MGTPCSAQSKLPEYNFNQNLTIFSTLSLSIAQFIDRSWEFYVRFAVGNEFFGRDLLQGGESYFSPSKTQPPRSATGMYLHSSWLLSGRIDLQPYTILIYCVSSIKTLLYSIIAIRNTSFSVKACFRTRDPTFPQARPCP